MTLRTMTAAAALTGGLLLPPAPAGAPTSLVPLDTSFGVGGAVSNPAPALSYGFRALPQPDGKLVLTGTRITAPGNVDFGLTRLNADGSPDTGFGTGGSATLEGGSTALDSGPVAAALQPDGKIVVATETSSFAGQQNWVVGRVRPDGSADPTFSGDGRLVVSFPVPAFYKLLADVLIRDDGRILVVGSAGNNVVAAQFHPDGGVDRSYGVEGRAVLPLPGSSGQVNAAALDAAGNVVVAGYVGLPDTGGDMMVARVLPDGRFDPAFGVQGIVVVDSGLGYDIAWAMDIDPQGRILLAGTFGRAGDLDHPGIVRVLPDGRLDPAFGVGGRLTIDTGKSSDYHHALGVGLLPDGRIAVGGQYVPTYGADEEYVLRKFVAVLGDDGTLDRSFDGDDGVAFLPQSVMAGGRLAVTGDGQIVVSSTGLVVRLDSHTDTAALSLTLGADQATAGPGPLTMTATVRNDGPVAATVTMQLSASKAVSVLSFSAGSCTVDGTRANVLCKLGSVAAGGSATVTLGTTVDGFEGTVFLNGSLSSGTPDLNPADNTALLEVLTTRDATI